MERNKGSERTTVPQFVKDTCESAIIGGITSVIQTELMRHGSSIPFNSNLIKKSFAIGFSSAVQKKLGI